MGKREGDTKHPLELETHTMATETLTEFEIEDMNDVAEQLVRKYQRTYRWTNAEDLMQQAWATMLKARPKWDPEVGVALEGYLHRAAHHALRDFIWSDISPAHVPLRHKGAEVFNHTRSNSETVQADIEHRRHADFCDAPVPPDEELAADQWHAHVLNEMLDIFEKDKEGHLARPVLLGEQRPAAVAAEHGVKVRAVYQAARRCRHALSNNHDLYKLWRIKA